MAENLHIPKTQDRNIIYAALLPQIAAVVNGETDEIANMANIAAILREAFQFFWVGFYRVKENQLVLGPFQGPLACTRIAFGRGVCGQVYRNAKTAIVPNVEEFPGHIACSSLSRSEIGVPYFNAEGQVRGVLDVDSDLLNDFSAVDQEWLEKIVGLLP